MVKRMGPRLREPERGITQPRADVFDHPCSLVECYAYGMKILGALGTLRSHSCSVDLVSFSPHKAQHLSYVQIAPNYRVTLVVAGFPRFIPLSAQFCSGREEFSRISRATRQEGGTSKWGHPNPGPRPPESPCMYYGYIKEEWLNTCSTRRTHFQCSGWLPWVGNK